MVLAGRGPAGHVDEDGGVVRLSVRSEAGGISVDVADEGEGIPEDRRSKIFELFYSTKERGTGLGLPLTREIVVAHGGRIWADSSPGQGLRLSFTLPITADKVRA